MKQTMRPHHIIILLITLSRFHFSNGADPKNRRILHQPLFPAEPTPTPPPPPTPDLPDDQVQPFSNEFPAQQPPPLPPITTAVATPVPVPVPSTNPTKKVTIAALSAVITLGMLTAMILYLYKHRRESHDESQKTALVSQRIDEESRIPPSTLLCIEPSTSGLLNGSGSPHHKPNPWKRSHHYRPSPELPPPTKPPPPPPRINSPPPMSSSDDESNDIARFYAPRPSSGQQLSSHRSTWARPHNHVSNSVPHSKRTPPKSRFSASSSPDATNIQSTNQSLSASLGPLQPSKTLLYSPKRTKYSASPPQKQLRSTSNHEQKISKIPIPPPPPPPLSKQLIRPKSKSRSPKASLSSETVEEVKQSGDVEDRDGSMPKMKPLHWDKVRATTEKATVWDQLKCPSFSLNEDAVESLFGCNAVVPKEATRKKFVLPCFEQEIKILDSKKSQNIAILLRALNVTREEVTEALLDGNPEGLGPELFETLVKMAPSREEEIKLKDYNDEMSKLGAAERFLKALLDIPFAFRRVEAMLYRANFSAEVKYLRKSFQTLEEASEELKNSRLFLKLLEAVLRTGNCMNNGTNRGDAKAFKLDTLLKLVDIKGTDGKTTLLHFVVQEVIRSEGAGANAGLPQTNFKLNDEDDFSKQGLQVVAGLGKELGNVKKAAGMDSDVLSSYVSKLELGLQKVRQVLRYESQIEQDRFFDSMKVFLEEAVDEISRIKAEERKALSLVKEVTQYFHGDDAKKEAHPLRIFMVIRDFLAILDNVCKDVGRMQDRVMGSGRSFRISTTTPLPVLSRCNAHNDTSSDDDSV